VDRLRFDADPDPDTNFHVDTNSDPDSLDFTHVGKSYFFYTFNCSRSQFFIFLISVKNAIILSILASILKFCGKIFLYQSYYMPGISTDPDRHALDASDKMMPIRHDADPEPGPQQCFCA
jgi:hypothetical protein